MSSINTSMRPGVTADYAPQSARANAAIKSVGIIGSAPDLYTVPVPVIERFSNFDDAHAAYGDSPLTALIRAVFDNAACDVAVVRVNAGNSTHYQMALTLLAAQASVGCIVGSDPAPELCLFAAELLQDTARCNEPKLYFVACPELDGPPELAESINCERVILTAPPLLPSGNIEGGTNVSAAVLAAITARQGSPSSNLFGEDVLGDYTIPTPLPESVINSLLRRGVTVLEPGALCPCVVRGVTTRTRNAEGVTDYSFRNISVPRTIDYVAQVLNDAITNRMQLSGLALSSLSSLVEWELIQLVEAGLISGYDKPVLAVDELDPSLCDISIGFTIRQGVAQVALHLRYE